MGLRFRRSIKIAPGVRVNLNKKSASVTFGPKGLKHTVSTTGKSHTTVGVPGTGLSYTTSGGERSASVPAAQRPTSPKSKAVVLPLCPDKGTCLDYDPNLAASVYLENDLEQLMRTHA